MDKPRSQMNPQAVEKLRKALALLKEGKPKAAQPLLVSVLQEYPNTEQAWYALSYCVSDLKDQIYALEQVLRINPENEGASLRLNKFKKQIAAQAAPQKEEAPAEVLVPPERPAKEKVPAANFSERFRLFFRRMNWYLFLGFIMVLLTVVVAVLGPSLAPKDPNAQFQVVNHNDQWFTSPFPAFQVPEHPFGTDQLGRDLFSQILWAVRPTLILVLIAASIRLVMGIILGLIAGWTSGRLGRMMDILLAGALATPVLVVALAVVAAISVEGSLRAFIVGLSLTGWAETARIIREQTRNIKGQMYIEAAHSMGATSFQILVRHVLRQVMSMVWMLFSFEVGSTLLVTASLGFLGYYIGGEVFVIVSDTTAERISSVPELGQMLATSWVSLTEPWGLFATGLAVLFIVLGFNLVAEGLNRRQAAQLSGRNMLLNSLVEGFKFRFEEWVTYPLGVWWREKAPRKAFAVIAVSALATALGYGIYVQFFIPQEIISFEGLHPVPGNHQWGSAFHDPMGSAFANVLGPQEEPEIIWRFEIPDGFIGGPVVAADGILYAVSFQGIVYAVDPDDGSIIWQNQLDPGIGASGPPALGLNGEVYIADGSAGLTAFSSSGDKLWYFTPRFNNEAAGGPVVGWDGTIYYATAGAVQAVSPQGEELWFGVAKPNLQRNMPKISPNGNFVMIDDIALNTADGTKADIRAVENAVASDSTRFSRDFLEIDPLGRMYIQSQNLLVEWSLSEEGDIQVEAPIVYDQALTVLGEAAVQGFTPDQVFWQLFTDFASIHDTSMHSIDNEGRVIGTQPILNHFFRRASNEKDNSSSHGKVR